MGKSCKFCGIPYAKLSPRHRCSYALYNKGIRHSAAKVKSRQIYYWDTPTWTGYRSQWPEIYTAADQVCQ